MKEERGGQEICTLTEEKKMSKYLPKMKDRFLMLEYN